MRQLSDHERRAVVLHHLVGYSVADIAAEFGAAEGTVKSWLPRGRTHLAALLTVQGEDTHGHR